MIDRGRLAGTPATFARNDVPSLKHDDGQVQKDSSEGDVDEGI